MVHRFHEGVAAVSPHKYQDLGSRVKTHCIAHLMSKVEVKTWSFRDASKLFNQSSLFLPIFMYILLCCVIYNCTVHWADLTYISLLIIFGVIEYVTNKTLNQIIQGVKWMQHWINALTLWGLSVLPGSIDLHAFLVHAPALATGSITLHRLELTRVQTYWHQGDAFSLHCTLSLELAWG